MSDQLRGPRLPPELIEMIVEHSRHDVNNLREFSRVSTGLRSVAVKHLFDRVTLSTVHSYHQWSQFVANFPDVAEHYLKILIIESGQEYPILPGAGHQFLGDATAYTPQRILDQPPEALPLRDLPISTVDTLVWTSTTTVNEHRFPTVDHIVASLQTLKNLHIIRGRFAGIEQFQLFLRRCGCIKFLELHQIALDDERINGSQPAPVHDLAALEDLRISSTNPVDWVVHHVLLRSPPVHFKALSLESSFCLSHDAFQELLQSVSPSLGQLSVVVDSIAQEGLERMGLHSLPPLPLMTCLHVAMPLVTVSTQARVIELLQWSATFIDIFAQADGLSKVTFVLNVGSMERLHQVIGNLNGEWSSLLNKIPLSFLNVLTIAIHLIVDRRPTETEVETVEPLLKGSGLTVRILVYWDVAPENPGRYGIYLPDGLSPIVAFALRTN
ncbi:hypothetical protein V5O48_002533 [Marasmius crinis-equi]|uniref:F-box domain-containing protein n=1 Tax=Marasmius crinis-equi TaxID=585013 RepID=A0ABR3FVE8_9AGAR